VGTRRLTCGQPSSQAPFPQLSPKGEDLASYVAFDLRFLFPQDCLGVSAARRRLCWLVLIMAVRGFARTDSEGGGRVTASWLRLCLRTWELLAVAHPRTCVQGSRVLLPVIPPSRLHLQLGHDLPGRNRSVVRISQPRATGI
jgi:hypothetical protein